MTNDKYETACWVVAFMLLVIASIIAVANCASTPERPSTQMPQVWIEDDEFRPLTEAEFIEFQKSLKRKE